MNRKSFESMLIDGNKVQIALIRRKAQEQKYLKIGKKKKCQNSLLYSIFDLMSHDSWLGTLDHLTISLVDKGQLISKCPFGQKTSSKCQRNFCPISALKFFVASWGLLGSFLSLLGDLVSNIINKEAYRKPPKASILKLTDLYQKKLS